MSLCRIKLVKCVPKYFKLNSELTKSHLKIFIFTHVLNKKIQTDIYLLMECSENWNFLKPKKVVENLSIKTFLCLHNMQNTFLNTTKSNLVLLNY